MIAIAFGICFAALMYQMLQESKQTGTSFQKGDSVTAFGNKGVVKEVSVNGYVTVKFDDFDSTVVFNTDGRLMKWHKQVSLKHV